MLKQIVDFKSLSAATNGFLGPFGSNTMVYTMVYIMVFHYDKQYHVGFQNRLLNILPKFLYCTFLALFILLYKSVDPVYNISHLTLRNLESY